uniref:Uncharacterized protein n=1 Tax=Oryza rufipogon TaxID=4529 RepID=A0A0E0QFS3_ORYRU
MRNCERVAGDGGNGGHRECDEIGNQSRGAPPMEACSSAGACAPRQAKAVGEALLLGGNHWCTGTHSGADMRARPRQCSPAPVRVMTWTYGDALLHGAQARRVHLHYLVHIMLCGNTTGWNQKMKRSSKTARRNHKKKDRDLTPTNEGIHLTRSADIMGTTYLHGTYINIFWLSYFCVVCFDQKKVAQNKKKDPCKLK